nr:hypothetical protein [uncultured Rhodopila sp.]
MGSNLSVAVTADATQLRSSLALAQQDVKSYSAALRAAATDIKQSGTATAEQTVALDKASASFNKATAEARALKAQLEANSGAARSVTNAVNETTGAMHNHSAATEAMVLIHEAMSGRFTKMGGSLMILTQRIAGASMAMMGLAGVFAVAAMGAMHLTEWLEKVHNAKLLAEAGGIGSGLSQAQLDESVSSLRTLSGVTTEEAGKIVHAYASMRGATAPIMTELTNVTRQYALRAGDDNTAAAAKIAAAFSLEGSAATEVMEKIRATTATTRELQDAITNNEPIKARTILLQELARSAREVDTQTRASANSEREQAAASAGMWAGMASGMSEMAGASSNPKGGAELIDAARTETDIAVAQRLKDAIASVNTELKAPAALSWAEQQRTALAAATLATVEAGRRQGEGWKAISEDRLKTEVDFWKKSLAATRDGSKEQEEAKRSLFQAEENLDMMREKHGEAGAKQALEARLAELSAEQSAQRDNFSAVMAIESQKLALLKAGGANYTRQYQEELKHQEDMLRAHTYQAQKIELDGLTKSEARGRDELATKRSNLDAEVSDHLMTKQAEISQLAAYAEAQYQTEKAELDSFIANNKLETATLAAALEDRKSLETKHEKEMAALRAAMAQADRQTAMATEREWTQAFGAIGAAGERSVAGLLTGTTTVRQAEMSVARTVIESAVSMGAKVVEQWAATEIAKTFITDAGVAERVAAEQAATGTSGFGAILAHWLGLEAAKTGTVVAGNATQTASTVAAQGAQTIAVAAGAEAQAAATIAGKSEAAAASAAINGPSIMADAAKAAAGAYSAVASIPYVGPVLAPIAAGVAFAAVAGYESMASLDVGTMNVPQDMMANIHQGEIVVPAFEASLIRGGQASLGAGDGSSGASGGGDTHVHFNVSALDGASVHAFLRSNGPKIAQIVAAQQSRNPSMRASY